MGVGVGWAERLTGALVRDVDRKSTFGLSDDEMVAEVSDRVRHDLDIEGLDEPVGGLLGVG